MPQNRYALETNKSKSIEISWLGFVYDGTQMTVSFDGKAIGQISDITALTQGQEFLLPDGSSIKVQLEEEAGVQVFHDGRLLDCTEKTMQAMPRGLVPKSSEMARQIKPNIETIESLKGANKPKQDAFEKSKVTYQFVFGFFYFLGGLFIIMGLLAALAEFEILQKFGISYLGFIEGLVFIGLGVLIQKKTVIPLIVAASLFGIAIISSIVEMISKGVSFIAIVGAVFYAVLIAVLLSGISAIRALKKAAV